MLPQQGLVETEVLRRILLMTELPFAANACDIAGFFHEMSESRLCAHERAEVQVIAHIVFARHELHAGGRAQWLRMTVFKAHARGGETIEMRRLIRFAPILGHALVAEVIGHDENDIRLRQ